MTVVTVSPDVLTPPSSLHPVLATRFQRRDSSERRCMSPSGQWPVLLPCRVSHATMDEMVISGQRGGAGERKDCDQGAGHLFGDRKAWRRLPLVDGSTLDFSLVCPAGGKEEGFALWFRDLLWHTLQV